jgi:Fanconi anemia group J protein
MAVIGSRKHLCANKSALKSGDVDCRCSMLLATQSCPYQMRSGIPLEFRPHGSHGKHDIDDYLAHGETMKRCPYHMSLIILSKADLVFCPYNYVIDPVIKDQLELDLAGAILIVDEAHNIDNVCRQASSFRLSKDDFVFALGVLKKLEPSEDLLFAAELLSNVSNWFQALARGLRFTHETERIEPDAKCVFANWNITPQNWPLTRETLMKALGRRREMPARLTNIIERLFVLLDLAFGENMSRIGDFRVAVTIGDDDVLVGACLNPGIVFRRMTRDTASIVLASGTLSPLSTFSEELQTPFNISISAPHVIDGDQVAAFVVSHGLDGILLNSSFQHLKMQGPTVNFSLGKLFECLAPVIPDGLLLFVPSFAFLEGLIAGWNRNEIWTTLCSAKPIFYEERDGTGDVFLRYKKSVAKGKGGFLLGVCHGRMSEGMDFLDGQARAVFVFGIPYPPFKDVEVVMKREYNKAAGRNDWYETQGFRALFQAVGRCIRHQSDYGAIVLIDSRFNFMSQFPNWIRNSFRDHIGISDIRERLIQFFAVMRIRFPTVIRLNAGAPALFVCRKCGEDVLHLQTLDQDKAYPITKQGFLEVTGAAALESQALFVNQAAKKTLSAGVLMEVEWKKEDKLGYNLVVCHCGERIGVRIKVGGSDDTAVLGGMWLLMARMKMVPIPAAGAKKPGKKKAGMKADVLMKGQKKLSFT